MGVAACAALSHAQQSVDASLLVQVCFVTGFEHYDGKRVFPRMQVGDVLHLVREAGNRHDGNAVRVEWQGYKVGYVPRNSNEGIARQLDFGNRLRARVIRLSRHRDADRRVEIEIFLPL
ncbi:MAG: HIRAN domain-containing protein [Betaproteobacteria bacterium]|nr:MAG: HIRAN domain-containing protein [Betaproteobacteria bacterium]